MMRWLDKRRVTLRPMTPADGDALDQVIAGMSPVSRRNRYLADIERLTEPTRAALLDIDGARQVAFLAEARRGRTIEPIGIARYVADGLGTAEIAYEVVDAWQGHGVGRRLLRQLVAAARDAGIVRLVASLHRDNVASMGLLRTELPTVRVRRDGELIEVTCHLDDTLSAGDVLADLGAAA